MVGVETSELVAAATANLIAWHDCSVRALGFTTRHGDHWWTNPTPGPSIYFTAIEARPASGRVGRDASRRELRRHLDDPNGSYEAVCVSFADLDLRREGLSSRNSGLWYGRPPGSPPAARGGADLDIVEVTNDEELAEFEVATTAAFEAPAPIARFDIHAPAVLDDPRMHIFIGRHDGQVVSGAMAYEDDDVLGIYGVGTVPGHRGRGWATAITTAALATATDRPAVLQPSLAAARMYRTMGFAEIGQFVHWG